jgi:hypothetical protein
MAAPMRKYQFLQLSSRRLKKRLINKILSLGTLILLLVDLDWPAKMEKIPCTEF